MFTLLWVLVIILAHYIRFYSTIRIFLPRKSLEVISRLPCRRRSEQIRKMDFLPGCLWGGCVELLPGLVVPSLDEDVLSDNALEVCADVDLNPMHDLFIFFVKMLLPCRGVRPG